MELDDELCLCFHVSRRKVVNYVRLAKPRVPSQLSQCGGAGTGCGWCVPFLRKLFAQETGRGVEGTDKVATDDVSTDQAEPTSAADYARQRGSYLRAGKGTPPPGATPPPDET